MKTTKKTLPFPALLTRALLGLALLAAGCAMPGQEKPAAPAPGVLRVTLEGGGDAAGASRTLLPGNDGVTSLYYTLTFTATDGPAKTEKLPVVNAAIAIGASAGEYTLAAGTWSLAVKGYASQSSPVVLVSGEASDIVVASAAGTEITVTLTPAASGQGGNTGTGTLRYDISFPKDMDRASLAVYDAEGKLAEPTDGTSDPEPIANPIPLAGANTGSLALVPGVYNLEITLYRAGKAAVKRLTAHIYRGLVTAAVDVFAEADFADYETEEVISSFALDAKYPGRIDHAARTITVFVPSDLSLSGLGAVIEHAGLVISPDPYQGQDYTKPVSYAVSLEDNRTVTYTVRVSSNEVSTVEELTALLASHKAANTAETPVQVKMMKDTNLGDGGWAAILAAIGSADPKIYLDLDLSDCVMDGTEFDPGNAEENYITGLVLPDAAESIKAGTASASIFQNFTNLKTLGASKVRTVGDHAFYNLFGLTSLSLPAAETIGDYALYGLTGLTGLSLPSAETIGNQAFANSTKLATLSLPAAASIGDNAFDGCTGLTLLSLPAAASIGDFAFSTCIGLTALSLPEATSIENNAFAGLSGLRSLSLPAAETIGDYAFYGCIGLTSLDLPEAASIGDSAFANLTGLKSLSLPKAANIGASAFSGCANLTTLSLPEAISIGNSAFKDCTGLTALSLPKAVTIGDFVFATCSGLTSLDLPKAETIGASTFSGRTGLASLTLPAATSIGASAFYGCTGLKTLNLPKAASIGASAFYNCSGLKTLNLPVAAGIGASAFSGCAGLTSLNLPAVRIIEDRVFYNCAGLVQLSLPEATSIGASAFSGCTGFTTLSLPKAESIGASAFSGCANLTSLTLDEATSIGASAFYGCTGLRSLPLPEATSIGASAFSGCANLTTLSLPVVTNIGNLAFENTGVTALEITLGATVPRVGVLMFYSVSNSKPVTVKVPSGVTGYGTTPTNTSGYNWGNAFRGRGWDGSSYGDYYVNGYITLTIQALASS